VDDNAERLVQLGGIAEGMISALEKRSKLPEYPLTIAEGVAHLTALQNSVAQFAEAVRNSIDEAAETPDAATADLMTEVSRAMDKYLWLIEGYLQTKAADVSGVSPKRSGAA
jgi:starvation-inducible DNA-binding protein